jgi:hypothetical protein
LPCTSSLGPSLDDDESDEDEPVVEDEEPVDDESDDESGDDDCAEAVEPSDVSTTNATPSTTTKPAKRRA